MIAPLSPAHQALIESRQPYNGWNGKRDHPLLALEQTSNRDKHRTLRPAVLAAAELNIQGDFLGQDCHMLGEGGIAFIAGRPLQPDTVLFRIPDRSQRWT
jgi:hypothetical protein